MKIRLLSISTSFCLALTITYAQNSIVSKLIDSRSFKTETLLWYDTPAKEWEEALPVGNGRLGAMVFGKNGEERIQFNEETLWSGGPYSTLVKGGYKVLPKIQKLIFEGKPLEAHKLFGRNLMGNPVEQMKYQSLANLHIFFEDQKKVTDYKRWLNLETATIGVEYSAHGVVYRREILASAPDQVIMIRLTANQSGKISFRTELRGVRNITHSNYGNDYFQMDGVGNDGLMINGKSADYLGVDGRLRYRAQIKAVSEGGTMHVDGTQLYVNGADAVTLYFVAATNFINYKNVGANQIARVDNYLKNIKDKTYKDMREASIQDYQSYYRRASLKLTDTENSILPTDKRMKAFENGSDPNLAALAYNFGRYLLISSSRPGTEAANLQGIWNDDQNPSWDSKYTTNINLEMNYWPVETGNLSDCAEPLITLIKELTDQGSKVAKEHYGANGWVFHQNTDLWRVAAPMDGPTWGTFTVGGAWLTTHLWEHYL